MAKAEDRRGELEITLVINTRKHNQIFPWYSPWCQTQMRLEECETREYKCQLLWPYKIAELWNKKVKIHSLNKHWLTKCTASWPKEPDRKEEKQVLNRLFIKMKKKNKHREAIKNIT
jgi:hypothetical protein